MNRLTPIFFVFLLVVLGFTTINYIVSLVTPSTSQNTPQVAQRGGGGARNFPLRTSTPVQNLGEKDQLTEHELTYIIENTSNEIIENTSNETIELIRVYESCFCSQIQFPKGILEPKQSREVKVKWKLGNTRGRQELLIPIEYQTESTEKALFPLKASVTVRADIEKASVTVRADIEFDTQALIFENPKTEKVISVHYRTDRYEIDRVLTDHEAIRAQYDRSAQKIHVQIDSDQWPKDKAEGYVLVETTNPNEPAIRFPVLMR